MTDEDERELENELARLQQEHRDLDAAIEWAARCPGAKYGSIEVRPIMVFDNP